MGITLNHSPSHWPAPTIKICCGLNAMLCQVACNFLSFPIVLSGLLPISITNVMPFRRVVISLWTAIQYSMPAMTEFYWVEWGFKFNCRWGWRTCMSEIRREPSPPRRELLLHQSTWFSTRQCPCRTLGNLRSGLILLRRTFFHRINP